MKNIHYASIVGSFMYSQVCTRTNVTFVVRMLGRYQSKSDLKPWRAAKEVLRYLKGTKDCMLRSRENDNLDVGYSKLWFVGFVDPL